MTFLGDCTVAALVKKSGRRVPLGCLSLVDPEGIRVVGELSNISRVRWSREGASSRVAPVAMERVMMGKTKRSPHVRTRERATRKRIPVRARRKWLVAYRNCPLRTLWMPLITHLWIRDMWKANESTPLATASVKVEIYKSPFGHRPGLLTW